MPPVCRPGSPGSPGHPAPSAGQFPGLVPRAPNSDTGAPEGGGSGGGMTR
jgi:hypothetical protein